MFELRNAMGPAQGNFSNECLTFFTETPRYWIQPLVHIHHRFASYQHLFMAILFVPNTKYLMEQVLK